MSVCDVLYATALCIDASIFLALGTAPMLCFGKLMPSSESCCMLGIGSGCSLGGIIEAVVCNLRRTAFALISLSFSHDLTQLAARVPAPLPLAVVSQIGKKDHTMAMLRTHELSSSFSAPRSSEVGGEIDRDRKPRPGKADPGQGVTLASCRGNAKVSPVKMAYG